MRPDVAEPLEASDEANGASRNGGSAELLHGFSLLLVVLVILTGGGITATSQAVALIGVGALLLWKLPLHLGNRWILTGLGGILLLGVLSVFVPRFGGSGPTFSALEESLGLRLPSTWSLQPRATLESLVIFIAASAWALLLWGNPLGPSGRRVMARAAVFLGTLLGIGVLVGNGMEARWIFAREAEIFTFIPNRNQMGSVLMLAAVFAFATSMDSLKRRGSWTLLGFVCCVVLVVALMQLHSRAVILLFFVGIILWFLLLGMGRPHQLYVKLGVPLTLILFSFFLFFGQTSRDRILDQLRFTGDGEVQTIEYRLLLYRDSLQMIAERPLTGFGMGNFASAFPQFRDASYHAERVIHPDSDVFWLLAEMGLVGGFFAALAVFGVFRLLRFGRFRGADAIRLAALACLILFLLHSIVDVGAHRLGSVMMMVTLASFGMSRRHGMALTVRRLGSVSWRVAGLLLILGGILWVTGATAGVPITREQQQQLLQKRLEQASESGSHERFTRTAAGYRNAYPASWESYFATASGLLQLGQADRETIRNFRIARVLNPTSPRMVFQEAEAWLPVNPSRSIDAWREALRRPRDPSRDHRQRIAQYYRELPALRPALLRLSESDSALRFLLLSQLGGADFRREMDRDLEFDETLSFYDVSHRRGLLIRYARNGGGPRLLELLDRYPGLAEPEFELRAIGLASSGRLREAVELLRRALPRPEIPVKDEFSSRRQLAREFAAQPNDILKGTLLLHRLIDERDWAGAVETVGTLSRNPQLPPYLYYWAGEVYFLQDDLENSWVAFLNYLRHL